MFRALGLGPIIEAAETMTGDDQEYLFHVGNNGLVITRAGIVARMQSPDISPKELADLSMALQRISNELAKHTNEDDPDAGANTPDDFDEELQRLNALEGLE
jgi:hypothetical protein